MNKFKKAFIFSVIFTILFIALTFITIGYSLVIDIFKDNFLFNIFIIWFVSFAIGVMIVDDLETL